MYIALAIKELQFARYFVFPGINLYLTLLKIYAYANLYADLFYVGTQKKIEGQFDRLMVLPFITCTRLPFTIAGYRIVLQVHV